MSKQTNIIVNRYTPSAGNYAASVSPEGGGWTLFVPADGGAPDLWIETAATDEHGASVRTMVPARDHADPRHVAEVTAARAAAAKRMRDRYAEVAEDCGGFDGDAVTAMRITDRIRGIDLTADG